MNNTFELRYGDSLEVLQQYPDNHFDAVVTDGPYGLLFMNKRWDYDVPSVAIWKEVLRVLKPGGHMLAFAGARTQHRMAVNIEDAGFEIRDMIAWTYGCLDTETLAVTKGGTKPYTDIVVGEDVLCYDVATGTYSYLPVLEVLEYDYNDTAYRLVGNTGEQVVSRNHRVIVERGGKEVFVLAEEAAREQQARVPFLENLCGLQQAFYDTHKGTSTEEQVLREGVLRRSDKSFQKEGLTNIAGGEEGRSNFVCGVRERGVEAECLDKTNRESCVQSELQREDACSGVEETRTQGTRSMERGSRGRNQGENDRKEQPLVEGRGDLSETKGIVCKPKDQVCEVPSTSSTDGEKGRLHSRAQDGCSRCNGKVSNVDGMCSSHQSRCDGQQGGELDGVCDQRGTQGIRGWEGHSSSVVRIVPFNYTGKVWCLRVPTGSFVASRNGVVFPTGNSGFPKNKNLGDGFGSALKPAIEPITLARKPFKGSLENNYKEVGTGGLNIDGCKVGVDAITINRHSGYNSNSLNGSTKGMWRGEKEVVTGRFPANLLHDNSPEVVSLFPDSKGSGGSVPEVRITGYGDKNVGTGKSEYIGGERTKVDCGDGSAARFFKACEWSEEDSELYDELKALVYCAKANKKDRNNGCEDIKTWESVDQNQLTGSLNELQKVVSGNMTQHLESTEWNTFLFGSNITEQCQKGIKYIIEMALKTTTELKTLNCSQHLSIRDFILGVIEMTTDSGSNLVTLAESTNLLIQNTTNAKTELVLRVVHAVLLDLLEISKHVKQGNTHSTVKPTNLMRYLCRLVTPPCGTILDPFMGSGSTGKAALLEGFNFVGIDLDEAYVDIARRRIEAVANKHPVKS